MPLSIGGFKSLDCNFHGNGLLGKAAFDRIFRFGLCFALIPYNDLNYSSNKVTLGHQYTYRKRTMLNFLSESGLVFPRSLCAGELTSKRTPFG